MENEFSYKDSLKAIEAMIAQAKHRPGKADAVMTLLWGYLVAAAALLHWYLETVVHTPNAPMAWMLMLAGAVVTSIVSWKTQQHQRVKTFIDNLIVQLWIAFGVSFVVLCVAMGPPSPHFLPSVMLLYGGTMWVHGALLKFVPYQIGAVACWLGSALAFWLPPEQQLLVLAGVMIPGYLIPGHLLYAKTASTHV
jgi:hypothetical protein